LSDGGYTVTKDDVTVATLEDHCNLTEISNKPIIYANEDMVIIFNQDINENTLCYTIIH